jgi:hypothetical protein
MQSSNSARPIKLSTSRHAPTPRFRLAKRIAWHLFLLSLTTTFTIAYVYIADDQAGATPVAAQHSETPIPQVVITAKRMTPEQKQMDIEAEKLAELHAGSHTEIVTRATK